MERIKEILEENFKQDVELSIQSTGYLPKKEYDEAIEMAFGRASQEITTYLIEECKRLKKDTTQFGYQGILMGINAPQGNIHYNQALDDVIKMLEGE